MENGIAERARSLEEAFRLPVLHFSRASIENHLVQWIFTLVLLAVGLTVAFVGHKFKGMTLFFIGAVLAGSVCYGGLMQNFAGQDWTSVLMGEVVVAIGACIGGIFTNLLTQEALGLSLGFFAIIVMLLIEGGTAFSHTLTSLLLNAVVFVSLSVLGWLASLKSEIAVTLLSTSLTGAFVVLCAFDVAGLLKAKTSILSDLAALLRYDWGAIGECPKGGCHGFEALALWLVVALTGFVFQAWYTTHLTVWLPSLDRRRAGYTAVRGSSGSAQGVAKQRNDLRARWKADDPIPHSGKMPENFLRLPELNQQVGPQQPPLDGRDYQTDVLNAVTRHVDYMAGLFGFQIDNACNQAEHISMLLFCYRRYTSAGWKDLYKWKEGVNLNVTPVQYLHDKLFANYRRWAHTLGIRCVFFNNTAALGIPPGQGSRPGAQWYQTEEGLCKLYDVVLWFLIWGEAGNLRHMPECLCFLYHKMAAYLARSVTKQSTMCEPGDFLYRTVTPIYEIVAKNMGKRTDHDNRRNYDDFNEFFWKPECLKYGFTLRDKVEPGATSPPPLFHTVTGEADEEPPIWEALERGPKTYVEKRSWIAIMLAFRRLIDWHVISFHILVVLAFWKLLAWDYPYALQLMSSFFLVLSLLAILWVSLEVWMACQGAEMEPEVKTGFILRLCVRYCLLVYQVLFYTLSLKSDGLNLVPGVTIADKGDQLYYWWQYLWISLVSISVWLLNCVMQLVPVLSSEIFQTNNLYGRALVNIIFSQSRNYTAKRVHESQGNVLTYMVFWLTLLYWKLSFSYRFEVAPTALPSLELYDDLVNLPDQSTTVTIILIVARWLPFACIYMLDTLIWYSVWAGLTGLLVGLSEKLGEVTDFKDIRTNFMKTPEGFYSRLIASTPGDREKLSDPSGLEKASPMPRRFPNSNKDLTALETQPLIAPSGHPPTRTLSYTMPPALRPGAAGGREDPFFSVAGTKKWRVFAQSWNSIVQNLRETDIISNDERDMLVFHFFQGRGSHHDVQPPGDSETGQPPDEFNKPVYLPVFQTAGCIERAVHLCEEVGNKFRNADSELPQPLVDLEKQFNEALRAEVTVYEALTETCELGLFFIAKLLGDQHAVELEFIRGALYPLFQEDERPPNAPPLSPEDQWAKLVLTNLKLEKIKPVVKHLGTIVSVLRSALPKRVVKERPEDPVRSDADTRTLTPTRGKTLAPMTRSWSAGLLSALSPPEKQQEIVDTTDSLRDRVREPLRHFLASAKDLIVTNRRCQDVSGSITNIMQKGTGFLFSNHYASTQLDRLCSPENKPQVLAIMAKLHGLICLHIADAEPQSPEAKRRLTFFVNSLFMNVPKAPSLEDMLSWTVMTPYYSEDVIYSKKDCLTSPAASSTDGVSTMLYLQTLYKSDWKNFLERMGLKDDSKVWTPRYERETRMWASRRAQTLARTVEGMMYYEKALEILDRLEREGVSEVNTNVRRKFGYVVSCQVYGKMKMNQDSKAEDIEMLLHTFPSLRVAYIDEVQSVNRPAQYFSVLIRSVRGKGGQPTIEEVYRVKLPGNPILGEGKPENQNHAIIFTRGEHVQAIDMNQEGYFEEAFKMRNMLQEFAKGAQKDVKTTILGFREHIFTGSVSSLANYMALQEYSFVTLGQRVLNKPLRMRLHYGHPDLFDKVFFMQNGGISKASKGINLSEDIFAGYNNCLRGGGVDFKEYLQVGKGRDVGMQQIYKFEAKLSQGAAEQSISRDVYRLLNRVDFWRLMSFYFGGIGHYLSSVLTVLAIWLLVYLMLGLALFEREKIGDRPIVPQGLLQLVLAGVGVLQTVPLFCTLVVEKGFMNSLWEVLQVFLSGGPLYFIFHIRTRDYYYTQTILRGGASYRATGRGFVTNHSPFDENFRFFANSHFYLGFEIAVALVLFAIYSTSGQYAGRTWSLWIASVSFIFAPFWFNPLTFEWNRVRNDYRAWLRWMSTTGGAVENSWETWWRDENSYAKNLSTSAKIFMVLKTAPYLMVALGLIYRPLFIDFKFDELTYSLIKIGQALILLAIYLVIDAIAPWLRRRYHDARVYMRIFKMLLLAGMACIVIFVLVQHPGYFKYMLALGYFGATVSTVLLVLGFPQVSLFHFLHDIIVAHVIFIPLFLFSALQVPSHIQTWLLYHNALSQGVLIEDIIRYTHQTKESETGAAGDELKDSELMKQMAIEISKLQQQLKDQSSTGTLTPSPVGKDAKPPQPERMGLLGKSTASSSSLQRLNGAKTEQAPEIFTFKQPENFPAR